jgi:hypothetical protein
MRVGKIEGATGVNASKDAKIFHIADVVIATDARTENKVYIWQAKLAKKDSSVSQGEIHGRLWCGRCVKIHWRDREYVSSEAVTFELLGRFQICFLHCVQKCILR